MTPAQEEAFYAAIDAVYIPDEDFSSSDDDGVLSSLGDWREISKRLDSDFESEEEEQEPVIQSLPSDTSASSNSTSSSIQSVLKRAPKLKKPKKERVLRETPAKTFACTYQNCKSTYTSAKSFRKHLADHQGMLTLLTICTRCSNSFILDTRRMYLCIVCSQRFLRMQDLKSHLNFNHKGN